MVGRSCELEGGGAGRKRHQSNGGHLLSPTHPLPISAEPDKVDDSGEEEESQGLHQRIINK